jgi:hypothetical protein
MIMVLTPDKKAQAAAAKRSAESDEDPVDEASDNSN